MTIQVDNTAKVSGFTTAVLSWMSGAMAAVLHPTGDARPLVQIVIAIIGGLFGLAGTSLAVVVKHRLDNRKARESKSVERE